MKATKTTMSPSSGYSSSGELWGLPLMPNEVELEILLPNGIYFELEVARETILFDLKDKVWKHAKEYPLFNKLLDHKSYVFSGITQDAQNEEFYNEKQHLCDLHLFRPMLWLKEAEGNREEKVLKRDINLAIGKCIDDFDCMKSSEVDEFRWDVSNHCMKEINHINSTVKVDQLKALEFWYPPRLEASSELPQNIKNRTKQTFDIRILDGNAYYSSEMSISITLRISFFAKPREILVDAMKKMNLRGILFPNPKESNNNEIYNDYTLKICGLREYLVGDYPISQHKYIRHCILRNEFPNIILIEVKDILSELPIEHFYSLPNIAKTKLLKNNNNSARMEQTSTIKTFFKVHVLSAAYVNLKDQEKVYVCLNIFHGSNKLCVTQKTQSISGTPKWNEWLEFNISICDIPRSAKLCLSICVLKRKKEKDEHWPLAWANIYLFDYEGYLIQGKSSIHLWPVPYSMETSLNPLGVAGSNPCKESQIIELEFEDFKCDIQYPDKWNIPHQELECTVISSMANTKPLYSDDCLQIQETLSQDPLYELTSDERDLLWNNRKYCIQFPDSLPKLLNSVNWHQRDEVGQIYTLLRQWHLLPIDVALELLDIRYPDLNVRTFATKCLEKLLTDDDILKYLLQLVTAIKYEPYLKNNLSYFLIKRAINNPHIGHYFFWHLKAEIHNPEVTKKYGLILEAFCRACGRNLRRFTKQTEMIEKLMNLNTTLKKSDLVSSKTLWDHLDKSDFKDTMENICSPINPSQELGSILVDLCEVKSSAKKPFILHWKNADPLSVNTEPNLAILFKNGDDLRQDQLTLQILHVMDEIWQHDNLDLHITPYKCISMGLEVGMIEIVQHSETLLGVQKKNGVVGSLQLKSGGLHQWLKDNNMGVEQYEKAVRNFTYSCAGYCVATFILGIGDRHNDNIMIKKNGQLFHIDFGHFLNNKKKKYGFRRERLPFVLTDDFMKVICRGANEPVKTNEYTAFQDLCLQAFISIRDRSNLIINLLSLMTGAGIPELSSYSDLSYVRQALGVDVTQYEAVEFFRECLNNAHNGQHFTHFDWACHAVRHGALKS